MTDSNYYYGLCAFWPDSEKGYDFGWKQGGTQIELDLTQYATDEDVWIASTFKKESAGTDTFSTETIASLGWSAVVEY